MSELSDALVRQFERTWRGPGFFQVDGEQYSVVLPDGRTVAKFKMRASLQCSAIVVTYGVLVDPEFRGRGIGKSLCQLRIDAARAAGYSLMVCTSRADNEPQNHILQSLGWKETKRFHSLKTGNDLILWIQDLQEGTDAPQ